MNTNVHIPSFLIAAVLLVSACGDGAASTTGSGNKTGASSVTATAKPPAGPAAKPELEDMTNETLGLTMKMPKGFATTLSTEAGAVYTFGQLSVFAQIAPQPAAKFEDVLIGYATDDMTLDKKTEGDLLLVLGYKKVEPKPVHVYAAPKGAKFSVHCVTDDANKDLAREVCSSVKIKK